MDNNNINNSVPGAIEQQLANFNISLQSTDEGESTESAVSQNYVQTYLHVMTDFVDLQEPRCVDVYVEAMSL